MVQGLRASVGLRHLALDRDREPVAEALQPVTERVHRAPHHRHGGERRVLRAARGHELLVRLEHFPHARELRGGNLPAVEGGDGRTEIARQEPEPRVEAGERLPQLVDEPRAEEVTLGRRLRAAGGSLAHALHVR